MSDEYNHNINHIVLYKQILANCVRDNSLRNTESGHADNGPGEGGSFLLG